MCASWGVSSSYESTFRLRTVSPVATSSCRARSAKPWIPIAVNISWAVRSCVARVDASVLSPEPLAVQQMRASELRTDRGSAQVIDCVAVTLLGGNTFGEQRFRPALNADRPVGAARYGGLLQALERRRARGRLSAARRGLDELVHVDGRGARPRGLDRFRRDAERGLVLPEAVVEDCGRPQDAREPEPVTRARARAIWSSITLDAPSAPCRPA